MINNNFRINDYKEGIFDRLKFYNLKLEGLIVEKPSVLFSISGILNTLKMINFYFIIYYVV